MLYFACSRNFGRLKYSVYGNIALCIKQQSNASQSDLSVNKTVVVLLKLGFGLLVVVLNAFISAYQMAMCHFY